ncbi:Crp/Fnr family transcriptional regulator [Ramlibacter rhizophilus]|uniref:Crp/Fnr family transcriptional regulator n=1 Tax=Ramlibacter rhizophilus TaxID=1781167 RepID=A0A4Z0BYZ8_9BURK|nr:Crp/Fnr family transcriptional regulator [Ramlibacter rhizophilus]TFZ03518.1 Crp/Fnr family transcriptional regulator [Ramlibacter rhizophilus]
MVECIEACRNRLLAALPTDVLRRWLPQLEPVQLRLGDSVYEAGQPQRHVYFPTTALVSLLHVLHNGASAEIAIVGNDGAVGISIFLGGGSTSTRGVVQGSGHAIRCPSSMLLAEFERDGAVMHLLLRYTQALISQMTQTAACNRHHRIEQQLCRWLLLSLDRIATTDLNMTQELISNMLGVRREGVTQAAAKLQCKGLIQYSRGHITVLHRKELELHACECYEVVKKEYDRLLGRVCDQQLEFAGGVCERARVARTCVRYRTERDT